MGNPHPLSSVYSLLAPCNGRLPVATSFPLPHWDPPPLLGLQHLTSHFSPHCPIPGSPCCARCSHLRPVPGRPVWTPPLLAAVVQMLLMGGAISQRGRCLHVSGSSSPSSPSSHFLALMLQMGCPNVGETCGSGQALTTSLWALGAAPTLMQVPACLPQTEKVPPFRSL